MRYFSATFNISPNNPPTNLHFLIKYFPFYIIFKFRWKFIFTLSKFSCKPNPCSISYTIYANNFGIPLEQPLSRPLIINYQRDHKLEEDYEIGWSWFEVDTGPQIALYSGFHQCVYYIIHKINQNTSLKLYLISTCTQLWSSKWTNAHKEKYRKVSLYTKLILD